VVHDPVGRGRYATLHARGGVRLWVNGEEATELAVVQAADRLEFRLPGAAEAGPLALEISPDAMTVTARLLHDPRRLPDTVAVVGKNQAELWPAASAGAPPAQEAPQAWARRCLAAAGVRFGVDDAALDQLLSGPVGGQAVVARGRDACQPTSGTWEWLAEPNQLVQAGDLLAMYHPGEPNLPRIDVRGNETLVFAPAVDSEFVSAGDGARAMAGGTRIVAARTGRFDRRVGAPGQWTVAVHPARLVAGDQNGGHFEADGDLVFTGSLQGVQVRATGGVVVHGNCQGCTIEGRTVHILGDLAESEVITATRGHVAALLPDYAWFAEQVRWGVENSVLPGEKREEHLRVMLARLQAVRRAADALGLQDSVGRRLLEALTKVLLGVGLPGIVSHGRALVEALDKLVLDTRQELAGRDVTVGGSVLRGKIWAGGNLHVGGGKVNASQFYVGGTLTSANETVWTQTECFVAGHMHVGVLSSIRGEYACTLRIGAHLTAQEVLPGTIVEVGHQRQEFRSEIFKVKVGLNARGELKMQRLE
jgi:hypothetical protein